jgi:hypothetical protein
LTIAPERTSLADAPTRPGADHAPGKTNKAVAGAGGMKSYMVGKIEELADGERRVISCDGTEVGVFMVDGELVAW